MRPDQQNGAEPAFPFDSGLYGLTKREYFAAAALQGLCMRNTPMEQAATTAVLYADATLKRLSE